MRDLSPSFAAAAAAARITPAILVHLDFAGQPLRAWSGLGPLLYESQTYLGFGTLADIEPIEEYSEIRAGTVRLTLTKVPNTALSDLPSIVFKRRHAEVFLALFDSGTDELIGVETLLRGTMDTMSLSRSPESSTIELTIANELSRLRQSWGSLYTDPHQQQLFPDDTGLRFVASIQDLQISI